MEDTETRAGEQQEVTEGEERASPEENTTPVVAEHETAQEGAPPDTPVETPLPPSPESPAVSFEQSTIQIMVHFYPDDGQQEGREVMITMRQNSDGPLVARYRLNTLLATVRELQQTDPSTLLVMLGQLLLEEKTRQAELAAALPKPATTSAYVTPTKSARKKEAHSSKSTAHTSTQAEEAAVTVTLPLAPSEPVAPVTGAEQASLF
jgi:hypothetical protein